MDIQQYIENNIPKEWNITEIGCLTKGQLLNELCKHKYIDNHIYFFDLEDEPDFNNWIEYEGIHGGWLFIQFLKYKNMKVYTKKVIKRLRWSAVWDYDNQSIYHYYDKTNKLHGYLYENPKMNAIFEIRTSQRPWFSW